LYELRSLSPPLFNCLGDGRYSMFRRLRVTWVVSGEWRVPELLQLILHLYELGPLSDRHCSTVLETAATIRRLCVIWVSGVRERLTVRYTIYKKHKEIF